MNKYCRLSDSVGNAPTDESVEKVPTEDSPGNKIPLAKVAIHKAQRAIEKLL